MEFVGIRPEPDTGDSGTSTATISSVDSSMENVSPATVSALRVNLELEGVVPVNASSAEFLSSGDVEPSTSENTVAKKARSGSTSFVVSHVSDLSIGSSVPRITEPEVSSTSGSARGCSYLSVPSSSTRKSHRHSTSNNSNLNPGGSVTGEVRGIHTEVSISLEAGADVESIGSRVEPDTGDSVSGTATISIADGGVHNVRPSSVDASGNDLESELVALVDAFFT